MEAKTCCSRVTVPLVSSFDNLARQQNGERVEAATILNGILELDLTNVPPLQATFRRSRKQVVLTIETVDPTLASSFTMKLDNLLSDLTFYFQGTEADALIPRQACGGRGIHAFLSYTAIDDFRLETNVAEYNSDFATSFGLGEYVARLSATPLAAADPIEACEPLSNDLTGKVALIRRGDCVFADKIRRAQAAGAVATLIVNNVDGPLNGGGLDFSVTIPSWAISLDVGNALVDALDNGQDVNVSLTAQTTLVNFGGRNAGLQFVSARPSNGAFAADLVWRATPDDSSRSFFASGRYRFNRSSISYELPKNNACCSLSVERSGDTVQKTIQEK